MSLLFLTDDEIETIKLKTISYEMYDDDEYGIDWEIYGLEDFALEIQKAFKEKNNVT